MDYPAKRGFPEMPGTEQEGLERARKPETRGTLLGGFEYESRPSAKHEHRNEDAIGGDMDRIERDISQAEAGELPIMTTDMKFDTTAVLNAARREAQYAVPCIENGTDWVIDGASGEEMEMDTGTGKVKLEGVGMVASRIASAEIARVMSGLPKDADDAAAIENMRQAILTADKTMRTYKDLAVRRKPADQQEGRAFELKNAGCAATLFNKKENEDGTVDIRYASIGDTAMSVFDSKTGELRPVTRPGDLPTFLLDVGGLTEKEIEYVMSVRKDDKGIPPHLKAAVMSRQGIMKSVGGASKMDTGLYLQLLDTASSFSSDEKQLIRSTERPEDLVEALVDPAKLPRIRKALEYRAKLKAAGGEIKMNEPDTGVVKLRPGERLIAYSDGLDGNLSPEEIRDALARGMNLAEAARAKGKKEDDISIVEFEAPMTRTDEKEFEEIGLEEAEEVADAAELAALDEKRLESAREDIEEMELDIDDEDVEVIPEPPPIPTAKKGGLFGGLFGRR